MALDGNHIAGQPGHVQDHNAIDNTLASLLQAPSALLTTSAIKTVSFTATAGYFTPIDTTSNAVTANLPTAPADKTIVGFKLVIKPGSNIVTVRTGGSDVINRAGGPTSFTISLLSQGSQLQYNAAGQIWYVIDDDLPLSQLSTLYAPATGSTTYVPFSAPRETITYNADGTPATITETDTGAVTTYTYNADGTPATEARVLNGATTTRTFGYTSGNLVSVT